jgi:thiosulfate reductase cytochrome b subunit
MYVNSSSAQQNRKTDFVNARRPMLNAFSGRQQQPFLIRICHWFNVVFITVMAGSGLQILTAYPALGSRGEQYWWYPFQNVAPPSWLKIGGWLEGGRHWHFTIGGSS